MLLWGQLRTEGVCLEGVGLSNGARFPNALFPNASFPYEDRSYEWNPDGTDLRYKNFPFPIFLVEEHLAEAVQNAASENAKQVGRCFLYAWGFV